LEVLLAELLAELLERCKKGDRSAMELLVRRYREGAYALARALAGDEHLAEDAVQEAFIEALSRLGQLRDPDAFAAWLRRIVRTRVGRIMRKRHEHVSEIAINGAAAGVGPSEAAATSEVTGLIRRSIEGLSAANREAARLYYLDELDQTAVADRLGVPEGTVRRRLHDSRRQLREMLMWYFDDGEKVLRPGGQEKII
jgi:RNA polymerase sigma factor (sigma-70 family)